MNRLFVYGTLRNGRLATVVPEIAGSIRLQKKGYIKGRLFDTGEYPGAVPYPKGEKKVYGDIIEIDEAKVDTVLQILDEYEEFYKNDIKNSLFTRNLVTVNINDTKTVKSWVYWYNREVKNLKEIKDGVYRKRKQIISSL